MYFFIKSAVLTAALTVFLAFLVGCGGGDPKSLAAQQTDLLKETVELMKSGVKEGDPKAVALEKKSNALDKKVEKLSEADKKTYNEEMKRLINGK